MAELFLTDLENVQAGLYPLPNDHDGNLPTLLKRSQLFFEDLPSIHRRREEGRVFEVRDEHDEERLPRYYMQNFHFQTDGWMSADSAKRYDTQVEVLFSGTANAIRRQALVPLHELFSGRDQRDLCLLDVGCGTGRFLDFVKQAWPRLPVIGLDLSAAYLSEAQRHLKRWCWIDFLLSNAEKIRLPDESQNAVTSTFLFHELPPSVRCRTMAECARVLKRGGRLIIVDSLQLGDKPEYDCMLMRFPQNYHEPYYSTYLKEDFAQLGRDCGLAYLGCRPAFLGKVMTFEKG
jgi:ubiquinone/menaquinone biosynthesis C-methylase UbiE